MKSIINHKICTPSIKHTLTKKVKIYSKTKQNSPVKEKKSKTKVKSNLNSCKKLNKLMTINEISENPQDKIKPKPGRLTSKRLPKFKTKLNKIQAINIKQSTDIFDDSYLNNLLLTNESDSNRYEKANELDNKLLKENDSNYDHLYDLFRKSNLLKSTIIIDKNGNNNLVLEQKKIIDNYFDKRCVKSEKNLNYYEESKINSIPVQKYKENNKLFIQKTPIYISKNTYGKKSSNNVRQGQNTTGIKTQGNINRIINYKKLLKNKQNNDNNDKFIFIGKYFEKEKNKKKETDKISNFELASNKSIDSSFLGSYLNDSFYKELTLNENFF
jgi:hypothetical protein